jgi:exodeoxyribonuclease V alpha subunit
MMRELILLAPTGRASKRISELANFPASTIHRFLKWDKESNTFGININNKSDAKMVIIDEASMIDLNLFYSLLQGLHEDTKIVIVGDYDQLPSVGCGQVLKDLIESDSFLVVELKELYRQKETSNIIKFAYDIKNDNYDNSIFLGEDLTFIPCSNSNLKEKLYEIIKDYNYKDYDKFQVLAPIYAYDNGIDDLNNYLQDIINPKKNDNFIAVGEEIYRVNDKVIQLVNMPDENIYNGDVGIVEKINLKPKEIYVRYDENVVKYTPSIFDNIKHGFCISIHKAQGSEFDTVIIPVLHKYSRMLYKKLIYTAVTRSKKKLYILGEESALKEAIKNNSYKDRKTTLKDFIIDGINH